MDFDVSEASLRADMVAKNEYFMQKYKDYTRFIGNNSEEAEESDENIDDGGGYMSFVHTVFKLLYTIIIYVHIYR